MFKETPALLKNWSTIVLAAWLCLLMVMLILQPSKKTGKEWGTDVNGTVFCAIQIGLLLFHHRLIRRLKPQFIVKLLLLILLAFLAAPIGFLGVGFFITVLSHLGVPPKFN